MPNVTKFKIPNFVTFRSVASARIVPQSALIFFPRISMLAMGRQPQMA